MFTTHSEAKVQTLFFQQVQDPGMHYISYFGPVIRTYLPQGSVQKVFFCLFFLFAFCPLYHMQILFSTLFLSCVHTYILLYIQVHLTRLHLNTSWKTRHLVFSHMTSKKRSSSYVHSKNLHLVQFTKIT